MDGTALKLAISSYKKELLFLAGVFLLSITVNAFVRWTPQRTKPLFLSFFKSAKIEKLSRVEFSPDSNSDITFRVIKQKQNNKIYLDILVKKSDGSFEQTQFLELKGHQEAYFDFWNESHSLFALDHNGDGDLDLGVPTFDSFLRAHFELLVYDKDKQKFVLKKTQENPKINKRS